MEVTSQRYGAHRSLALVDYNDAAAILHSPKSCSLRNTAPAWPFSQRLAQALHSAEPPRKAHFTCREENLRSELSCRSDGRATHGVLVSDVQYTVAPSGGAAGERRAGRQALSGCIAKWAFSSRKGPKGVRCHVFVKGVFSTGHEG